MALRSVLSWRLRSRGGREAIDREADDLILECGYDACEEARRRRRDSNDLSAERHWAAVAIELLRRSRQGCLSAPDRKPSADAFGCSIWTPVADRRVESHRLAAIIAGAADEPSKGFGVLNLRCARVEIGGPARAKRDVIAELQAALLSPLVEGAHDELANESSRSGGATRIGR